MFPSDLKSLVTACPQNLSGCGCVSAVSEAATAVPGKCPSPGCQEVFLIFLCVICACSLVGAMAQTPSVIILIRWVLLLGTKTVNYKHKYASSARVTDSGWETKTGITLQLSLFHFDWYLNFFPLLKDGEP